MSVIDEFVKLNEENKELEEENKGLIKEFKEIPEEMSIWRMNVNQEKIENVNKLETMKKMWEELVYMEDYGKALQEQKESIKSKGRLEKLKEVIRTKIIILMYGKIIMKEEKAIREKNVSSKEINRLLKEFIGVYKKLKEDIQLEMKRL